MAQRTRVERVDDVDGSAADETVRFGLDGVVYEIDLTEPHADQLRTMSGLRRGAASVAAGTPPEHRFLHVAPSRLALSAGGHWTTGTPSAIEDKYLPGSWRPSRPRTATEARWVAWTRSTIPHMWLSCRTYSGRSVDADSRSAGLLPSPCIQIATIPCRSLRSR